MIKLLWRFAMLSLVSGVVFITFLSVWSVLSFQSKYSREEAREFILADGETLRSLSRRLEESHFIQNALLFKIYVRLGYNYKKFQAGRYLFQLEDSPQAIVSKFVEGNTYNEVVLKITLPEGFSLWQIIERLSEEGYETDKLTSLSKSSDFIRSLKIEGQNLEGYLYPSTYTFYNEIPTEKKIFQVMVEKFFSKLPENYLKRLKARGLTLQKAVIIASLIEKETSLDKERPLISEVIFNRLKRGMTLGIDASLMYGIENFNGNLTFKDLRNKNNPYNTRVHPGLPPGPICNPTRASLEAVLEPSEQGYLFYVLKPGVGQKAHHFSRSLSEHNTHVKKLVESQ